MKSKKQKVITEIFKFCVKRNNFVFHNELVKKISKKHNFGNPFDATKLDSLNKFPDILIKNNYFITHQGNGYHKFVKGIEKSFHKFEPISSKNIVDKEYKRSILNEYDTSESNMLSVGSNLKIFHHFLYGDTEATPKIYFPRRTKTSFEYYFDLVKNVSKEKTFHSCQIPQKLSEMLIKSCTLKGDVILIHFGGSGSEIEVCKMLKRQYISAEIDKKYHKMILDRLNKGKIAERYKLRFKKYETRNIAAQLTFSEEQEIYLADMKK